MRGLAIISIALSMAASILGLLVLFAGRKNGFLSDTYIIKVDTTNLTLNTSNTGNSVLDNILNSATPGTVNTTAERLGLRDFYKVFVMNFCEGDRDSNNKQISNCTKQKGMFTFNPVSTFNNQLLQGVKLQDLGVKTLELENDIKVLNVAYKTMFVTYCGGIAAAGVIMILGALGFFGGRLIECANMMFAVISFLFLGIASGIGTAAGFKICDAINHEMGKIGIRASHSKMYLGMTWAPVTCMLILTFLWCGACLSRGKDKTHHKDAGKRKSGGHKSDRAKRSWRKRKH
ncbi:actin cortical patch SUR7/pH-response regulator pali [Tuber borchii]|uniref:Actin cortical patch SUR7/pH-response regulator pali n=1 Tax=Tuber borchii TaxID=42251 RepID=A0A2T6ZZF0_TUBBO|nr:actin cortical patch SUR7/pH-response regulator pali [Tuber borchii]